jgi:ATP-binding cassette, subfamily C (CFTR/MRP), member 1
MPNFLNNFTTFGAYAIIAKIQGNGPLSVQQVITALSLLYLLLDPLADLLWALPQGFIAMGCIQRIEKFLQEPSRVERRFIDETSRTERQSGSFHNGDRRGVEAELAPLSSPVAESAGQPTVTFRDCTFGWDTKPSKPIAPVTTSLGLRRAEGSLTMIIGPVGCGKSTFLKAIIGETSSLNGRLEIQLPTVAYCEQTSWIISGTIRENIIAQSGIVDEEWYTNVVRACDLDMDFQHFPSGDLTVVGSKGMKLSGGQKQRIVIIALRLPAIEQKYLTRDRPLHELCTPVPRSLYLTMSSAGWTRLRSRLSSKRFVASMDFYAGLDAASF